MKKVVILGLMIITSIMMVGCGGKEKTEDDEKGAAKQSQEDIPAVQEADLADAGQSGEGEPETGGIDGVSTLCTDDKSISITVNRPEGFEDSEFSSEHQVAFQKVGEGGAGSTQISLRLMAEDENSVMTTAQQEVEYLLSANSDGGAVGEVQTQAVGEKQFSYFTYSLEGIEGYRIWTALDNGCILSCTAENIGSGLEPLALESLTQILSTVVQE